TLFPLCIHKSYHSVVTVCPRRPQGFVIALVAIWAIFSFASPVRAACDPAACDLGLPGDFDDDGDVDSADFALFHKCQDRPGDARVDPLCARTDLNGDGKTDSDDFALWQSNFT